SPPAGRLTKACWNVLQGAVVAPQVTLSTPPLETQTFDTAYAGPPASSASMAPSAVRDGADLALNFIMMSPFVFGRRVAGVRPLSAERRCEGKGRRQRRACRDARYTSEMLYAGDSFARARSSPLRCCRKRRTAGSDSSPIARS